MRILHTSDWHLGISMHNLSMYNEQKYFLDLLKSIITEKDIDGLIIAGDIFDSSVSNSDSIALYNNIATEVCLSANIPMFVIAGNHDGAARLSSMRELLKKSRLYVSGKLTRNIEAISFGNADIYLVPFFNIDEIRSLFPEKSITSYESAMRAVCDNIREAMNPEKVNIVVSHSFVSGASPSESERSAMVGTVNMVSKDVFKDFSYVALGHIHRKQKIADNIYYSGSPLKYSINEVNQNKYMLIYDTETEEVEEVVISPLHEMQLIEGNYEDILAQNSSDDFVKVIVKDKTVGLEMLEVLRSKFVNLVAVEGKSIYDNGNITTLTMEQVRNMTPEELIEKFFDENFDSDFETEQMQQFMNVLVSLETEELS